MYALESLPTAGYGEYLADVSWLNRVKWKYEGTVYSSSGTDRVVEKLKIWKIIEKLHSD